jgi:hypothetical protein
MVETMAMLAESYGDLASFAIVYVAEAHAGGWWAPMFGGGVHRGGMVQ